MTWGAIVTGLMLAAAVAVAPAHAGAANVVEVLNNVFAPNEIAVARGEGVTWLARDGGHTITADDGRFSFPEGRTSVRGDTFTWTFDADETFSYRCLVHGPGMRGVIIVGAGSPPPPPPPEPPRRVVPSPAYPSLARALDGAEPTTIVELQPGTYRTQTIVTTPDVTIRGAGASPADVVIDGGGQRALGLDVRADRVRIENLTVRGHGIAGISFDGATGFVADRILAAGNGSFGIRARASRRGTIRASTATGSSSAGIAVQGCETCDIDIDGVNASDNTIGVLIERAGSVIVRRSTISGNGSGIKLTGGPFEQRGSHIWSNSIRDNMPPGSHGAGVWIDGGSHDVVEHNRVTGHRYGVVVTGLAGPSLAHRVSVNMVDASSIEDLAWDGIGADVCFAGNTRKDQEPVSSAPPMAETLYPCGARYTPGLPWPAVTLSMVRP